ncbi:cation diffusion facilitator family transporter [Granulicoccus phenolivorans]|uniref:cation diffusion facilitator family transporter n=1 Tax=Granulicoccus phenolivorans TaxID=266854 RepID=UPI000400E71B|nr:cation diffusion facilitator family transporter [Granulicoccus phenolivorans]
MTPAKTGASGTVDKPVNLTKYAWLSIAVAIATITLKAGAWSITGSVGLLSDAAESVVNLVAAVVALVALQAAAKPASLKYHFGRTKAEYFSALVEGMMIFVAAAVILVSSVERFLHPQPVENGLLGLAISTIASILNGATGLLLIRVGKQHNSITLRADGKHLLTDVVTSAAVLVGVGLVLLTGWDRLDPIVAFLAGLNIIWTGTKLIRESVEGLLDKTLSRADNKAILDILDAHTTEEVNFHGLRTRESGHLQFSSVHVLVPGHWTVQRGHDLVESVERELIAALPRLQVVTHLEPIEDPSAYEEYDADLMELRADGISPATPPGTPGPADA